MSSTAVQANADSRAPLDRLSYTLLMREIEDFLYLEADVLDDRGWEQWLTFFDDDLRYWMPIRKNLPLAQRDKDITGDDEISWFENDKSLLVKRVKQLMTGVHWAEEPLSRVSHLVTNIRMVDPVDTVVDGGTVAIRSHFMTYRNRLETETDILVGRREETLKRVGGEFKIHRRKVILDQHVLTAKNLAFPLF